MAWTSCMVTFSLEIFLGLLMPGVPTAIIPIPWNAFWPSMVAALWMWSILSAMNWTACLSVISGSSRLIPWNTTALSSNFLTSVWDVQKPRWLKVSIRNLEPKVLCIWTARLICSGVITMFGRVLCTKAWPVAVIFRLASCLLMTCYRNCLKVSGI